MIRKLRTLALAAPIAFALSGNAHAVIVNIDASQTGCVNGSQCDGSPHQPVGTVIGDLISPAQLTLDAGTYTITNGAGLAGARSDFTAWRFNGGDNWVWAFMAIDDSTKTLLVQGCCGDAVYNTQAGAANESFALNYSSTLTLSQRTTIDFITEDYYPYDNAGGVALNIQSAVPEPGSLALMFGGLLAVTGVARRRSR